MAPHPIIKKANIRINLPDRFGELHIAIPLWASVFGSAFCEKALVESDFDIRVDFAIPGRRFSVVHLHNAKPKLWLLIYLSLISCGELADF